jgi:hypothetical protein
MKIGLVACVKAKQARPAPAGELYISPLFRKASAYCADHYDRWFILSAKYGLVRPDAVIEPYDLTLKDMPIGPRRLWARQVLAALETAGLIDEQFYLHAGDKYREFLEPRLRAVVPLEGLGIGRQLQWYTNRGY